MKDLPINQIICGDCLEVMKELPDKSIDMILCDLPYGTTACAWDTIIPFEPLWEQYERIIKDNGAIVLTASQPFTSVLATSNLKLFKYEWIWEKDKPSNFALANKQPMKYHENILVFYKKQSKYNKQITTGHKPMNGQASYGRTSNLSVPDIKVKEKFKGGKTTRNPSSIQKFNTPKHNSKDKSGYHPTQKPLEMFEYLIKTYTNKNDLVLDNCIGSGTTAMACINTGRNFIGIEIEEKYVKIARKLIEACKKQNQMRLFPLSKLEKPKYKGLFE